MLKTQTQYLVLIHTDSAYVLNGCNKWMPNWKRLGWKRLGWKRPKNRA
ncbi:RNase H family protein [Vibrio alginolyticus]